MSNRFVIPTPKDFSFRRSVGGHGWYDLLPFEYDEQRGRLTYSYFSRTSRRAESMTIARRSGSLAVTTSSASVDRPEAKAIVRHILRLDEDLEDFYGSVCAQDGFDWIRTISAGRLLRSRTVWEDLVKTLCTTNCSWSLTKSMTRNLVEKLGSFRGRRPKGFSDGQCDRGVVARIFSRRDTGRISFTLLYRTCEFGRVGRSRPGSMAPLRTADPGT